MRLKLLAFLFLCFLLGCLPGKKISPPLKPTKHWPKFTKPVDIETFNQALARSLNYYSRLPSGYTMRVGTIPYTVEELKESLNLFQFCMQEKNFNACLKAHFDLYEASGLNKKKEVLFTGYYQPVLYGSFTPTERYRYPIYRLPNEWVEIDLRRFNDPDLPPKVLIGMVHRHEVIPFYTREDIDFAYKLQGKGYELVWVDDPVELFFLHIQGSGIVILPDGKQIYIHYAASNGRPYRSIGQVIKAWESLENPNGLNIKHFLRNHPEKMKKIFSANPSYIFFKIVDKGPLGALSECLTPLYSVATDPSIFPRGALLFVDTKIPKVNESQELLGWEPFSSFVLNQDTGGAIKGPGRVDIYFGTGSKAEAQACYMAQRGKLYLLVKKKND
ncbi:MAG: MltA domain-containing protein [Candidatus Desulfofervidaceae bacterium]|nr:MltA domain-containing protein [Candidatus Desulfofervidaceae bacterium]MDL1969455.1 MltA domain-containing protein [Candidatus Desulfofervidaceae bacterium]